MVGDVPVPSPELASVPAVYRLLASSRANKCHAVLSRRRKLGELRSNVRRSGWHNLMAKPRRMLRLYWAFFKDPCNWRRQVQTMAILQVYD
jgi:hypothetical protein